MSEIVLKRFVESMNVLPELISSIGEDACIAIMRRSLPPCAELQSKQEWVLIDGMKQSPLPGQKPKYIEYLFTWWQDETGSRYKSDHEMTADIADLFARKDGEQA